MKLSPTESRCIVRPVDSHRNQASFDLAAFGKKDLYLFLTHIGKLPERDGDSSAISAFIARPYQ